MKPYAAARRSRFLAALAVVALGWLGLSPGARAEGSYQVGTNQWLWDYDVSVAQLTATTRPVYVNVLTAGEVINVSLCGSDDSDDLGIEIYNPSGTRVANPSITSNSTTATGKVACSSTMSAVLTSAYKYTTTVAGTYELRLQAASGMFRRFDITVTPNTSTSPNPQTAGGRAWARVWAFNGSDTFAASGATDADYFVRVPGGRLGTEYVWKLDLNAFAGYYYDITANSVGVNAPNSGYSVPRSGNSVTPLHPVYLSYPTDTVLPTPAPASVSSFRFVDNAGVDASISPGNTTGVQDSGFFRFTTDVTGTYAITVDTNGDSVYGAGDRLLLGTTIAGENSVAWDGRNAAGTVVANATYNARLQVRLGEYHFVAQDVETSGGSTAGSGLTIYRATSSSGTSDTAVFWDDTKRTGGGTTLPNGEQSSSAAAKHTWGNFDGSGIGEEGLIDTYVYGAATAEIAQAIVAGSDTPLGSGSVTLAKSARAFVGATATVRSATGAEAMPNDIVEYTLVATNAFSYSLAKMRVQDPLPANTIFVSVSATADFTGTVLYSVNGAAATPAWSATAPTSGVTASGVWVAVDTNGDSTITTADVVPAGKKITVTYRVRVR